MTFEIVPAEPDTVDLYCRVSTSAQAVLGYSLQTQMDAGLSYARVKGYKVLEVFCDEYTGESLDRPKLDEVRAHVKTHRVTKLIVYDIDRMARSLVYFLLLEEEFRRLGVTIEYVNGNFDDTDEGQLQKQIRAVIAEYERKKILERSKRGKRGKVIAGNVELGDRPPYGYRVRKGVRETMLEVVDEEAVIVCLIYQWYTDGDGGGKPLAINRIAKRLTKLGVPTRGDQFRHVIKKQAKGVWTAGMVRHVLTSETYVGTWYFGKTMMVKDPKVSRRKPSKKVKPGMKQVPRAREEWIAVPVPAIIERRVFDRANERLKKNPRFAAGRPPNNLYMMSRRLTCSCCGYGIRGKTTAPYQYYVCNGQYKKLTDCQLESFDVVLTDHTIWQWLKDQLQHPERITAGIREEQKAKEKLIKPLRDRVSLIDDMIKKTEASVSNLLDMAQADAGPKDLYIERKRQLECQRADLEIEKAKALAQLQTSALSDEQISGIEAFCAEVRDGLDGATFEDKQRYLELLEVYGTLAVEDGKKVVLVRCRLGKQQLALIPTWPL